MGNETSFRSFPAHVHNLLTVLLVKTHVVHTKIYPRYRSKKNISVARDDFSKWLEPHEDTTTDVVLLGHSMGGLLSAEVALMKPAPPASRPLKHRILGTINFDVPFLGMHPHVVKTGLASIFSPAEEPGDKWDPNQNDGNDNGIATSPSPNRKWTLNVGRNDTLWRPEQQDPNFNPSFQNDVVLPMRKGWQNTWHFIKKHSDNLGKATTQLVTSHLEFGGAMANYVELKQRYGKVRALAEEDENVRKTTLKATSAPRRVRFVNYYTASTGRVKKPKSPTPMLSPSGNQSRTSLSPEEARRGRSREGHNTADHTSSRSHSPQISLEEHSDEGVVKKEVEMPSSGDEDWDWAAETLTIEEPRALPDEEAEKILSATSTLSLDTTASLPPIPDLPQAPAPLDVSYIQDTATRRLVEREHTRAVKSYEKAVKEREKAVRARAKLEEKKERKALKDAEKSTKDAEKADKKAEADAQKAQEAPTEMTHAQREAIRLERERERMEAEGRRMRGERSSSPAAQPSQASTPSTSAPSPPPRKPSPQPATSPPVSVPRSASRSPAPEKPLKDHMFCTLPPKDSNGERDPLWVRVFMENVDEVGAHCGLFFVDERYERLVGEVADRVESWVHEDGDSRLVRGYSQDTKS